MKRWCAAAIVLAASICAQRAAVAAKGPSGDGPKPAVLATLSPGEVTALYTQALARVKTPAIWSCEYSVEQAGARNLEQRHRIYRSGSMERDETLSVDGRALIPPSVRIFRGRRSRYNVNLIAPNTGAYTFTYVGPRRNGHHVDYVFATKAKTPGAYVVDSVTIDGVRFLPQRVNFITKQNGITAHGSILYGRAEKYWVPFAATANASLKGHPSKEMIAWSRYGFPASLPPSTFSVPHPLPTIAAPALH